MKKQICLFMASLSVLQSLSGMPCLGKDAKNTLSGEAVFKQSCAQCHLGGGNSVKPSKPIAGSAKLAAFATFKAYLQAPVGHMPYYSHIIEDQAMLDALYKYCKSLRKPAIVGVGQPSLQLTPVNLADSRSVH